MALVCHLLGEVDVFRPASLDVAHRRALRDQPFRVRLVLFNDGCRKNPKKSDKHKDLIMLLKRTYTEWAQTYQCDSEARVVDTNVQGAVWIM